MALARDFLAIYGEEKTKRPPEIPESSPRDLQKSTGDDREGRTKGGRSSTPETPGMTPSQGSPAPKTSSLLRLGCQVDLPSYATRGPRGKYQGPPRCLGDCCPAPSIAPCTTADSCGAMVSSNNNAGVRPTLSHGPCLRASFRLSSSGGVFSEAPRRSSCDSAGRALPPAPGISPTDGRRESSRYTGRRR